MAEDVPQTDGSEPIIPKVGPKRIDAVLDFLPTFERPGYKYGQWVMREGYMPWYSYDGEVSRFIETIHKSKFVYVFNAVAWQDEAQRYIEHPRTIDTADLLTLRQLMTYHVRCDRFVGGHLGEMLESGHITAVLRRLKEIRAGMKPVPAASL